MTTVKEKVRLNDTEFEIALTPVLPRTENDLMVLDAPLPTPDEILERVPSIERLPRWEDGAPIPENRRAIENRHQEAIAKEFGVWGMVVPCADQPHAVKLQLRGDLIRIEWSPCDDLFGALGLMAPCHQWVRENQNQVACHLLRQAVETQVEPRLFEWFWKIKHVLYTKYESARHLAALICRQKRWDLAAQMLEEQGYAANAIENALRDEKINFESLRILFREMRKRGLIKGGISSIYSDYFLKTIARDVYHRELKGAVLVAYYYKRR